MIAFIGGTHSYWRVPARDLTPEEYAQATEGLSAEELALVATLYAVPGDQSAPAPEEPEPTPEPEPEPDPEEPEPEG